MKITCMITIFMLSIALIAALFIIYIPCLIISCIIDAYTEDIATIKMHRDIEAYLNNERDENEYWQIHTW